LLWLAVVLKSVSVANVGATGSSLGVTNLALGVTNLDVGVTNLSLGVKGLSVGVTNLSLGVTGLSVGVTASTVGVTNLPVGVTSLAVSATGLTVGIRGLVLQAFSKKNQTSLKIYFCHIVTIKQPISLKPQIIMLINLFTKTQPVFGKSVNVYYLCILSYQNITEDLTYNPK